MISLAIAVITDNDGDDLEIGLAITIEGAFVVVAALRPIPFLTVPTIGNVIGNQVVFLL